MVAALVFFMQGGFALVETGFHMIPKRGAPGPGIRDRTKGALEFGSRVSTGWERRKGRSPTFGISASS